MKKLSKWAKANPKSARIIIVCAHLFGGINACLLGLLLFVFDWEVSSWALVIMANLFFLAYLFYPKKNQKGILFKSAYTRRKTHDFSLVICAAVVLAFGGNQFLASDDFNDNPTAEATAEFMTYRTYSEGLTSKSGKQNLTNRARLKTMRKQIKQEFRTLKKEFKKQKEQGDQTGLKILLIVLTVAVILFLGYVIAGLSCSLSCSGQGGLATVVLLLGWAGLVWLGIFTIKTILRKLGKQKVVSNMPG